MIQDINAIFDNSFKIKQPKPTDPVLCYRSGGACAAQLSPLTFPTAADFDMSQLTYLFQIGGEDYYLADSAPADRWETADRRCLRVAEPKTRAFAAITGMHLNYWYARNRFCGRCGTQMIRSETERALICPDCRNTVYPTIAPAVIIGVVRQGRILVSHYATRPYGGLALLAGFCEIGETPEDTVRREVMEEVGLRVTRVRYAGSQPWGFDHDLLLGFYCEIEDGEIKVDHSELRDAYWLRRDEIGELADSASLTFDLIRRFRDGFEPFPQNETLTIRHTRRDELPEIMKIYAHARDFMAAHGNPRQWGQTHWPPEELIARDIERGKSYVCVSGNVLQGVFYYDFCADAEPGYRNIEDGEWASDQPYGVVHRAASAGLMPGIGSFILRWALAQAGYLRIDTHPDNKVMQGLLRKLGFRQRGIIHVTEDNDPRYAFDLTKGQEK